MTRSINQHRTAVQRAFERALEIAERREKQSLHEVERGLRSALFELGQALVLLFLAQAVARPRATTYKRAGARFVMAKQERASELGTLFGKVLFTRPVARPMGAPRGGCDLPIDRELGLSSGFSLGVILSTTRLCAQMAFSSSRQTFESFCEWAPSPRAVLRMVDAVGDRARAFLEQAPAPDDDGEVLVLQVDAKGAPTISSREYARRTRPRRVKRGNNRRHNQRRRRHEHPHVRRKPGDKSKNANMAVVGVIYTLRRDDEGMLDGPLNKRVCATFKGHKALFQWLHRDAVKRGYGTDKFERVHFLADGARTLWKLQKEYFPDAEVALDWYHIAEKLWAAAKCIHRKDHSARTAWVKQQQQRLHKGSFDAVMAALHGALQDTPLTGPGNKYRRKLLTKTIDHFERNRCRMRYHRLRRLDLDIATGVVEGAVRHLVGIRFDGPGMRWGDRRERLLHLRCVLLNDQWQQIEQHLAADHSFRLPPKPLPAQPYDAKPQVAT
jgi:hypothetical protein